MLERANIKDVPTKLRNPQANVICERMNHTVGNILCTIHQTDPPDNAQEAANIINDALATAQHALCMAVLSRTLRISSGSIALW